MPLGKAAGFDAGFNTGFGGAVAIVTSRAHPKRGRRLSMLPRLTPVEMEQLGIETSEFYYVRESYREVKRLFK